MYTKFENVIIVSKLKNKQRQSRILFLKKFLEPIKLPFTKKKVVLLTHTAHLRLTFPSVITKFSLHIFFTNQM